MGRNQFWVILILSLVIIACVGIWYKNRISESVNLAPNKVCNCPYDVGDIIEGTPNDGKKLKLFQSVSNSCGSTFSCSIGACSFLYNLVLENGRVQDGSILTVPCTG